MSLEEDLFRALNGAGNPFLDPVMLGLGVAGLLLFALLWAFPLWFGGRRREAVDLPILLVIDAAVVFVLKALIARPRPEIGMQLPVPLDDVTDFAFPSGHATRAFAAALLLAVRLRDWRWTLGLVAYAGLVGASRVYVGAHWPTDVIGGAILGLAWAFLFERLTRTARYASWRDRFVARLSGTGASGPITRGPQGRSGSPP